MTFGFDKCRTMLFYEGRSDTVLPSASIHHPDLEETYKYLGVLEADGVKLYVMKNPTDYYL